MTKYSGFEKEPDLTNPQQNLKGVWGMNDVAGQDDGFIHDLNNF
jgi:hypothetical protein